MVQNGGDIRLPDIGNMYPEFSQNSTESGRGTARLLVVDDEPSVLNVVTEALESAFQISRAATGEHALEQIFVRDPEILLMDYVLPDMEGVELIRQALLIKPSLRIAVMTGNGSDHVRNKALQNGALRFFEKPLNLRALSRELTDIAHSSFGWAGNGIDVLDLTQIMLLCRKNGVVQFGDEAHRGWLVFQDGRVLHASTQDQRGEKAYFAMVMFRDGPFQTLAGDRSDLEPNINMPTEALMLEGARFRDESENRDPAKNKDLKTTSTAAVISNNPREEKMQQIRDLLNLFMKEEGSRAALVVDWDGFVIDGVSKEAAFGVDAIGAVISTSLGSSQMIGRELQVGAVNLAMFEFDKGTVLVKVLGKNGILALLVDPTANLGLPRLQIRKLAPQLEAALA